MRDPEPQEVREVREVREALQSMHMLQPSSQEIQPQAHEDALHKSIQEAVDNRNC